MFIQKLHLEGQLVKWSLLPYQLALKVHRKDAMHSNDNNQKPLHATTLLISLGCIAFYAIAYLIWGEKLPVGGGLGWDGVTYAAYVKDFMGEITTTNDVYHVTRIFPSLLIYSVTTLLGLKIVTPYSVFVAFYILNNIMYLATAYLWYKICKFKSFNVYIFIIGFISLFINYACLKLSQYAAVFLDPCVLFFGTYILYLYLKQNYISMCILLLPAYFTWLIAIVLALPLIIYNFSDKYILSNSPQQKTNAAIVVLLFVGCVSLLLYVLLYRSNLVPDWSSALYSWNQAWWPTNGHRWIYFVLPTSIIIASIYVYFVALTSNIFSVLKNSYRVYLPHVLLYLILLAVCEALTFWLSHLSINYTGKTLFSGSEFLAITLLGSIAKPALNLIMHATFLGPFTILLLYYMRRIMIAANNENFGLLLFAVITYVMALNSHSRQLTFNVPFMIYLLCKSLNNLAEIKNKTLCLVTYAIAALVSSKIYYLINVAPLQGDILGYPFQRFFMNFGLWTIWRGYFFNIIVAILMCLLLYIGFYRNTRAAPLPLS